MVATVRATKLSQRGYRLPTGFGPDAAICGSHEVLRTRWTEPLEQIRGKLLAEGHWTGELEHTRKDGTQITVVSEWVIYRDQEGRPAAILEANNDITARKRAEEALADSRGRLAGIVESAMDAIITVDEQQRIVLFNPAAAKMFRCPAEKALGSPVERFIPHRFRDAHRGRIQKFGQTGETTRAMGHLGAISGLRLDGEEFPIEASISQVQVGGHKLFSVILRDITERKQAEDALVAAQRQLQMVTDTMAAGVACCSRDLRYLWVSRAYADWLGRPADQITARPIAEVIGAAGYEVIRPYVEGVLAGQQVEYEAEVDYPRLGRRWINARYTPTRDANGTVDGWVAVVTDITDRKRAEEALRASEEKFRTLTERAQASFGIVQGERFVYVNPYFAEISGYSIPELLSMSFPQLVHPDFQPTMRERARRRQMGEPVPNHYEFMMLTKSGQARWVDFSAGAILYKGSPAIIGSGFDITEHKRAVEALQASRQQLQEVNLHLEDRIAKRTAELERRAAQLCELASELTRAEQHERSRVAGILHDHLQQLLVGAKFGTSVLRGRLGEESQRQALQKIDALLNDSLETSRNLTIELSPPILHEGTLAASLRWLAGWMHDKHGLQVHLKTDETLNPQDEGVRILLFESVRELLFNIVKHARTDSACATLERCNDEHLRIIVADAGPGFDPGPHRRQDRSRGGFGLFSIRERLGLIGGRFEIDSAPGHGTQMTLVAPLRLPSAEPVAQALTSLSPSAAQAAAAMLEAPIRRPIAPGEPPRIRVLVADDHAVVRDGLAQLLQMHADVEVVGVAGDGQHAVELALGLRPDVILMDVSMPRLNGIDATRRVRSELPHVCVIGLSMHAEDEMAAWMREAGAVHYLTKTAPPDAVVAAIRNCVRRPAAPPGA